MTSVLIISNDLLHRIKEDPEFGARVYFDVSAFRRTVVSMMNSPLGQYGRVISVGRVDGEQIVSVQHGRGAPLPSDEYEALMKYRRSRDRKAKRAEREREER